MSYSFPFPPNCKVLELGGGTRPYFRPNLDVRAAENVDIVADFNKPLPIEDDEYDGIFSSYCIEHLSWRKVLLFLQECYRILKPGSKAVFLTANTEEQIKHVLNHDDWEDECSRILFGDQDYDENTHRNSLCPRYAIKLCSDAGFENIIIFPFGAIKTDMIIEAYKPIQSRKTMIEFNHDFFDNQNYYGVNSGIYRDHPNNWIAVEKIMEHDPKSVLEIGCARGYVVKKLESKGVKALGIENSDHCLMTRCTNNIIKYDITETPWPFEDNQFDLCFSSGVLEFIPENKIDAVIAEIKRISKKSLNAVNYKNKVHENAALKKNEKWWKNKLEEIISTDELFTGSLSLSIPHGDCLTKLNLGCFTNMFYQNWINIDIIPLQSYANLYGYKFLQHDLKNPLNFGNETVDLIYTSHMFEFLTKEEGVKLLVELYRIMKKDAVLRMLVTDAEKVSKHYLSKNLNIFDNINFDCKKSSQQSAKLRDLLFSGKNMIYDFEYINDVAEKIGFSVKKVGFNEGNEQIIKETTDCLPEISLIVEMKK